MNYQFTQSRARSRLIKLLIAKSSLELLFVIVLALGFYEQNFNNNFRGAVDFADSQRIEGWVVDESDPSGRVEVQLFIDNAFVESSVAEQSENNRRVFRFKTPRLSPGEHDARIYAGRDGGLRRTLQMIGRSVRFKVE